MVRHPRFELRGVEAMGLADRARAAVLRPPVDGRRNFFAP
jgi:hypothetical protein